MTPTLLLVRGELLNDALLKTILGREGVNVQAVTTATQALRALECHGHELRAAVFSIGRYDASALQLVRCIRSAILELPIVIATCLPEADLDERFQNDPHIEVISEPFDELRLRMALRKTGLIPSAEGDIEDAQGLAGPPFDGSRDVTPAGYRAGAALV